MARVVEEVEQEENPWQGNKYAHDDVHDHHSFRQYFFGSHYLNFQIYLIRFGLQLF